MTETKPFNISKRAVMTAYKTKHDNLKKLGINEYKGLGICEYKKRLLENIQQSSRWLFPFASTCILLIKECYLGNKFNGL